jgi:hypothetical protein
MSILSDLTIAELGKRLTIAGRLKLRPLCIYGSDKVPRGSTPTNKVDSCIAKAILTLAEKKKTPPLYIGEDTLNGCCGGGVAMFGFGPHAPGIKYFVSYGSPTFRNGAAEYLRASPELFEENRKRAGKITPLGKYIVMRACADLADQDPGVKSVLVFGVGDQIRNLCALVHFRSRDPFNEVIMPQGASCASFVTYASGMAENAPKEAVFIGPTDPTGNSWFPSDHLSLAMPIKMARRMCDDMTESFIMKRPKVAYPTR